MDGLSGVRDYQDFRRKDWWDKGYILLNPITKHKAYIYDYDELKKDEESFKEEGFWTKYRELKKSDPNSYEVQKVKHFFKRKSASEKQSINYPIQATGALCFKFSCIYFFKYLRENKLFNIVKMCIPVHDEINIEAPAEIADSVAKELYNCMIKAGKIFCTRCFLDADISTLEDGSLPTYWIH